MGGHLSGKRAIVTGASSGIGRALALKMAEGGASVLAVARTEIALAEIAGPHGDGAVEPFPGDVTDPDARRGMIDAVRERFGGLDLLVNNAGVAGSGHFCGGTEELLRRTMEVNFFAPAELTRLAVPLLTEGNEPALVNVSSMCGRRGIPAWPEYSASKFALCGFTEAMRGEMARFDIDVILIVPGLTNSGLPRHLLRNDAKRPVDYTQGMSTEYVADRIIRAIRKRAREVVLGSESRKLLLMNRFFPRTLDRLIARNVRKLYSDG